MNATDIAAYAQVGEQLFVVKLVLTAMQCLWLYDYFLTFGDEVQCAWSGRKSWVFALFIANRYTPIVHLIWVHFNMFRYREPICQATKWIPTLHSGAVTAFSQIAVALRVYAITGMNKWFGGLLALAIFAQLCSTILAIIWFALGPLQPLPEINLDAFHICIYKRWPLGELIYYVLAMLFDSLAFSTIILTSRRLRANGHSNMPTILQAVLRDATQYFILIFSAHILSTLFLYLAPADVQLIPGMANTIFVPVMASRLMLSLKKASLKPKGIWSLETMTNPSRGTSRQNGGIRFASQVPDGSHEQSLDSAALNGEDIELGAMSRPPRNHFS